MENRGYNRYKGPKKLVCNLLVIMIIISGFILTDNKAQGVCVTLDLLSILDDKEIVKIDNIKMIREGSQRYLELDDLDKRIGSCVFKISNINGLKISFTHRLGTVASQTQYSPDGTDEKDKYILGVSSDNIYQHRVRYLPNDKRYGKLRDGLYIHPKGKNWFKCYQDEGIYYFKELETDLNENMKKYKDELIDYGLNIYFSSNGKEFKRQKGELTVEKRVLEITENQFYEEISDSYLETIMIDKIPSGVKYIKVEINEVKSLQERDELDNVSSDENIIADQQSEISEWMSESDLGSLLSIKEINYIFSEESSKLIYDNQISDSEIQDNEMFGSSLGESIEGEIIFRERKKARRHGNKGKKRNNKPRVVYIDPPEVLGGSNDDLDESYETITKYYKNKRRPKGARVKKRINKVIKNIDNDDPDDDPDDGSESSFKSDQTKKSNSKERKRAKTSKKTKRKRRNNKNIKSSINTYDINQNQYVDNQDYDDTDEIDDESEIKDNDKRNSGKDKKKSKRKTKSKKSKRNKRKRSNKNKIKKENSNGNITGNENRYENGDENENGNENRDLDEDEKIYYINDKKIMNDPDDLSGLDVILTDQTDFKNSADKATNQQISYQNQSETSQKSKTTDNETDNQDKLFKTEKTVSKAYLSGLFLILSAVLSYDKIGVIKKIFKI